MNTTDNYIRRIEHEAIASQIADYLARGKTIEVVARGVSGMTDGLFGAMGQQIRKSMRTAAAAKKLYDDQPDTEESE